MVAPLLWFGRATALVVACLWILPAAAATNQLERGKYLLEAGSCITCHTAKKKDKKTGKVVHSAILAGGRALKSPFGTFYTPNITPDPQHGIGRWDDKDFIQAMREGVSPRGDQYFPAFPYPAFTGMTDADLLAIKAYIFSLPPVSRPSRQHALRFPFDQRIGMVLWKALYFNEGPYQPDPAMSERWNRGAYLVRAVLHCGECHTPRGMLGGLDGKRFLAGAKNGPEGETTANITPDRKTGIGRWSDVDLLFLLKDGLLPDGDVVGSLMYEVVENSTSRLTDADRRAIIAYLRLLRALENTEAPATRP
jgi:mono/diheme cytochrome c family protein